MRSHWFLILTCAALSRCSGPSPVSGQSEEQGEWVGKSVRLARMIERLRPWPEVGTTNLTMEDWDEYARAALVVQATDPVEVIIALEDFTKYFEYSFEAGVESPAEWSKPYLLLRVVFELPEELFTGQGGIEGPQGFGGFGLWARAPYERVPVTAAMPVHWRCGRPYLTAWRAGYSGSRYRAEDEYEYLRDNFKFRGRLEELVDYKRGSR